MTELKQDHPQQPMTVAMTFDLGKHGWGSCKIEVGHEAFEMTSISYVTDALGDLLRATLVVVAGGGSADCIFEREPAGWRLTLAREWSALDNIHRFRVRVAECDNTYAENAEGDWAELFSALCDVEAFAMSVEQAASKVLLDHGVDGYFDEWSQPFPIKALESLRTALATDVSAAVSDA